MVRNIGLAYLLPFEFLLCLPRGDGGVCSVGGSVLVEVDATVGELAERSLLLDLGGLDGILYQEGLLA